MIGNHSRVCIACPYEEILEFGKAIHNDTVVESEALGFTF
jgi:hypothetical protein